APGRSAAARAAARAAPPESGRPGLRPLRIRDPGHVGGSGLGVPAVRGLTRGSRVSAAARVVRRALEPRRVPDLDGTPAPGARRVPPGAGVRPDGGEPRRPV